MIAIISADDITSVTKFIITIGYHQDDPNQLAPNLNSYINGFSKNVREIMERFAFDQQIARMADQFAGLAIGLKVKWYFRLLISKRKTFHLADMKPFL
jgi:hypothetical protein